ncbi:MAG: hypothetical protein COX44_01775 [Candidatus Portnoybacteria bacterium CG23_combo_of_CG06-09_8_20_14_all_37_13]|uniref:DUF4037 domain-containing protein n=1 Tax=Candidatus Portnoybacteria bacterium CG23_combo_of_CG06-09_8_20_14_all_37_13 TaxID=1974819 RepID=A0A2G9YED6_9BACT|nr:MAG: hypothetical protein COX44_01775 [Candidatus Portnoybacteria bacterium CG23_combo_of_CG06-09_8_20_14_all_37_13]
MENSKINRQVIVVYSQLVLPKTVNIKPHIEDLAYDFVERLKGKKEVEGVVLLGGLGVRNFLDKHSDVDIAVFVDYKECELKILPTWLPRFDFHVKLPKPVDDIEDIEFNVHQQILSAEREHEWDEGKKEAYSQGNVVYDQRGFLTKFLEEKLAYDEEQRRRRLIEIVGQFSWYGEINPHRQIERGFIHNAHDLLNQTGEMIVEVLFLFNRRYRPHKKWRLETSFRLPRIPRNYEAHMKEAMLVKDYTPADIERRIVAFETITAPLQEQLIADGDIPENSYEYACRHFWGRQILDEPFSESVIRNLLASRVNLSSNKLRWLEAYLNFRLVASLEELKSLLEYDSALRGILSEEEISQMTEILNDKE